MRFFDRFLHKDAGDIQVMKAEVAVGEIFKQWLSSDIGRYVVGRAEQHEAEASRMLRDANPQDYERLVKLQADAKIPGLLLQWIEEAIDQGELAKFQLGEIVDEEER